MVQVRESSRFGFCYALGELIGETPTATSMKRRHRLRQQERALDPHRAVRGVCGPGREGCLAPPPGVDAWKPCSGRAAASVAQTHSVAGAAGVGFPTINRLALPGHAAFCRAAPDAPGRRDRSRLAPRDAALDQDGEFTDQPARAKPVE